MVVGARNLTRRDDRIVILSALWALADLHRLLPGNVSFLALSCRKNMRTKFRQASV